MPDSKVVASDRRKSNSHASLLLTTSSTHVQHADSHRGNARTPDENDQNSSLLSNDFVLMLDCSPSPQDVFCENTPEFRTSWLWLNKLTTMHCHTLYDLRMRNAYMSHFSVCLNQRRLTGVFEEPPPAELAWVDFTEKPEDQQCPNLTEMQRSCDLNQSSLAAVPSSALSCDCSGKRSTSEYWDTFSNCARPSGGTSVPSILKPQVQRSRRLLRPVHTTSDDEVRQLYKNQKANFRLNHSSSPSATQSSTSRSQSSPPKFSPRSNQKPNAFQNSDSQKSPEDVRKRMIDLMELIRMELRGEPILDNKDILEEELKRYRNFFDLHLQDGSDFDPHSNSVRVRVLLNMQKDLIRMLKEDLA